MLSVRRSSSESVASMPSSESLGGSERHVGQHLFEALVALGKILKMPSSTNPKYSYPMEEDSIAAIRLSSFKNWWEKLPQETRKNVRRSQKRGVVVDVREFDADLIKGISEVNNDSPMRQRKRNIYYGRSLDQVKKDYCSFVDRSDFICAYVENEMIGFLKLVYRGEVASILNFTPKASHSDKRPANALIAKAVETLRSEGNIVLDVWEYITMATKATTLCANSRVEMDSKRSWCPDSMFP